jgi:hypothetical protein
MTASLLTQDAREILENRANLEMLVRALKAGLERQDIEISAYNDKTPAATLRIGNSVVSIQNDRVYVRDYYANQRDVDELAETVQAIVKMLASRLRSDRVVAAIKANDIPIVSDDMVGTSRIVQILV